nr:HDOD domain-containing protein [Shewanella waksmanii]
MPALCSTVKSLEKLAKDDVSSLAILGRSVMHDNALTSKILKVANSAIYSKGITQVTTVSRAAVVLGFDTIRNICITAKLLSSLLENKGLSENVYQRLIKLMASSFQAAMLSKMMLKEHGEELQEEVFVAALLYQLGESAFWSMGGEPTEQLDRLLNECEDDKAQKAAVRHYLGGSFNQLSMGIARSWGLGEVLLKSLSHPDERTPEIRAIFLANKISELMAEPNVDLAALNLRITQAAEMLDVEVDEFKGRMIRCTKATAKLADAYGAKVLVDFLPKTELLTLDYQVAEVEQFVREPNQLIQLKKLRELTNCAVEQADFNRVLTVTLEGILEGLGVDRCALMLLSPNRKRLQPRLVLGEESEQMKQDFMVDVSQKSGVFADAISLKCPMFVDDPNSSKWRMYIDDELRGLTSHHGFMLAPVVVDSKVIGVIFADRLQTERVITAIEYDGFTHFAQLANVCLGAALHAH